MFNQATQGRGQDESNREGFLREMQSWITGLTPLTPIFILWFPVSFSLMDTIFLLEDLIKDLDGR